MANEKKKKKSQKGELSIDEEVSVRKAAKRSFHRKRGL